MYFTENDLVRQPNTQKWLELTRFLFTLDLSLIKSHKKVNNVNVVLKYRDSFTGNTRAEILAILIGI